MSLNAQFFASASALSQCPRWNLVEVAFAGRSNAGKSSLINAVTQVRGLARISKTPGRTRAINFFTAGQRLALVDLPGFGYARIAKSDAAQTAFALRQYLSGRTNLSALVLAVDARRGPQSEERELAASALESGREVIVAATKADKLKRSERAAALARFSELPRTAMFCSVITREGIEELRRWILKRGGEAQDGTRR